MSEEPEKVGNKSFAGNDSYLGRTVVEMRLATAAELQACIAKQQKLLAAGRQVSLGSLLLKAGFVTPSQLKRLISGGEDSGSHSIQQLPGFQLMRKIGAGAMASVYMAKQLSLDRVVAIKVLPPRLSEDAEFVDRFHKEGQAAARLNHNNIVQAIDVGEYGGSHYFVMEYVDGKTVHDEMSQIKAYSEQAALDIIIQIARALEHSHARGFIHRDVKPKNIMITKDRTAKLADMGLAREATDAKAAAAEKGRAYGTPYYISPEQIRGEEDVDFRADIYSLGATFYHMITGKVPFDGTTPADIMHKHLRETLTPVDHLNPALSTGLAEVIERAMAKDRRRRYQSTSDLLLDLEAVRRGESPPQAHIGYDDDLLHNLANGSGAAFEQNAAATEWAQNLPMSARRNTSIGLLIGLVVSLVLNLILVVILATG
ncbi:MAG: serine/threonine-protein kinase [Planctomycetota bacterium]